MLVDHDDSVVSGGGFLHNTPSSHKQPKAYSMKMLQHIAANIQLCSDVCCVVRCDDSGRLAQTWQEVVREASTPRRRSRRHQFYDELEEVYRKMYASAARRAVSSVLSAER